MKYYLLEVEIRDGENEYGDKMLIGADCLDEASKKVKKAILDNWGNDYKKDLKNWDSEKQRFDLFDRIISFEGLQEIPRKDAKILEKWGCYISPV